jgi:hypothetical protein
LISLLTVLTLANASLSCSASVDNLVPLPRKGLACNSPQSGGYHRGRRIAHCAPAQVTTAEH